MALYAVQTRHLKMANKINTSESEYCTMHIVSKDDGALCLRDDMKRNQSGMKQLVRHNRGPSSDISFQI